MSSGNTAALFIFMQGLLLKMLFIDDTCEKFSHLYIKILYSHHIIAKKIQIHRAFIQK